MADKNVKAELNAEDLEGVAGGVIVDKSDERVPDILNQRDPRPDPLRDDPLNVMAKDQGEKRGNKLSPIDGDRIRQVNRDTNRKRIEI